MYIYTQIQPAPIQRINFSQPKRDNEATVTPEHSESSMQSPPTKRVKPLAPPVDQHSLLTTLHKAHPSASVFSVVPGFPQPKPSSQVEDEPNLPPLLTSLYDSEYSDLNEDKLSEVVQCRLNDVQFTKEEAAFLEKSTKQQSSMLWYDHRKGRITASTFGRVARCAEQTYPLVKNIMQYTSINPFIPALNWGRNNEDQARAAYVSVMKDQHRNFTVARSGLCLHSEYPHLGATPDGFVSCDSCGEGLLEIKCPYKYLFEDYGVGISFVCGAAMITTSRFKEKWQCVRSHIVTLCVGRGRISMWKGSEEMMSFLKQFYQSWKTFSLNTYFQSC